MHIIKSNLNLIELWLADNNLFINLDKSCTITKSVTSYGIIGRSGPFENILKNQQQLKIRF